MTIKEIRALTGLSQVAFGREIDIPRRTVENWEGGVTTPPPYVLRMLERIVKEDYAAGKEKMMNKYYWLDNDFKYGDFSVPKFALIRGELVDGEKDRETEEVILWAAYEDVDGLAEAFADEDEDQMLELIDKYIEQELGFLPEYEIG